MNPSYSTEFAFDAFTKAFETARANIQAAMALHERKLHGIENESEWWYFGALLVGEDVLPKQVIELGCDGSNLCDQLN